MEWGGSQESIAGRPAVSWGAAGPRLAIWQLAEVLGLEALFLGVRVLDTRCGLVREPWKEDGGLTYRHSCCFQPRGDHLQDLACCGLVTVTVLQPLGSVTPARHPVVALTRHHAVGGSCGCQLQCVCACVYVCVYTCMCVCVRAYVHIVCVCEE